MRIRTFIIKEKRIHKIFKSEKDEHIHYKKGCGLIFVKIFCGLASKVISQTELADVTCLLSIAV